MEMEPTHAGSAAAWARRRLRCRQPIGTDNSRVVNAKPAVVGYSLAYASDLQNPYSPMECALDNYLEMVAD